MFYRRANGKDTRRFCSRACANRQRRGTPVGPGEEMLLKSMPRQRHKALEGTVKAWSSSAYKARKLLTPVVSRGEAQCSKCGHMVTPGQLWDVDHLIPQDAAPHLIHEPSNWAVAHRSCNRSAGAVYGNRKRGINPAEPVTLPEPSRTW